MRVYGPALPPLCVVAMTAINALHPRAVAVRVNGGAMRQLCKFGIAAVVIAKLRQVPDRIAMPRPRRALERKIVGQVINTVFFYDLFFFRIRAEFCFGMSFNEFNASGEIFITEKVPAIMNAKDCRN